jgi:hypothetical protein
LHPGPIDNQVLSGDYGDELSRKIQEGKDYVLLPSNITKKLFDHYNGGPNFPRAVCDQGTQYNPILYVKLYPVRSEIYVCNAANIDPVGKPIVIYYKECKTLSDIQTQIRISRHVRTQSFRLWTKVRAENLNSIQPLPEAESKHYLHPKRYCITDQTECIDGWKIATNLEMNVEDALSDRQCLEIIAEEPTNSDTRSSYNVLPDKCFPRNNYVQAWKKDLRVGDVVDCSDRHLKWCEAIIKDVNPDTGNITVHFRGWSDTFDEIVLKDDIESKIQPLFSKSKNWRNKIEEDDFIDVNISSLESDGDKPIPGKPCWLPAMVEEIDLVNQRICVSYKKQDALDLLTAFAQTGNGLPITTKSTDSEYQKRWIHIQSEGK